MIETRKEKIERVKKELSQYKFNIPVESFPDIPENRCQRVYVLFNVCFVRRRV